MKIKKILVILVHLCVVAILFLAMCVGIAAATHLFPIDPAVVNIRDRFATPNYWAGWMWSFLMVALFVIIGRWYAKHFPEYFTVYPDEEKDFWD